MDVLTGAFHLVAVVIMVGGSAKVASPDAFAAMLRSLGLPAGTSRSRLTWLARVSGLVEVALGATAIVVGGRVAAAVVAVAYLVFAVVVVAARRAGAASCGCFGAAASPPSVVHVVVNLASAAIALATAIAGELPPIDTVLGDQPMFGLPYLVTVATGAWLVITINTVGAVVLDRVAAVAELGPTFRENASAPHHHPARTGATRT